MRPTASTTDIQTARGRLTADELDAAYGAVTDRHPDLTGDELTRKVRRVAALLRYAGDGARWTAADRSNAHHTAGS